jgi:hypothetical protein
VWEEAGEGEDARANGPHRRTRLDTGDRRRSDTESSSEAVRRPLEAGDEAASDAPGLRAAHRTSRQRQGNGARPRQRGPANGRRARLTSTASATSAASLAPTVSDLHEAPVSGLPQGETDEDEEAEAETERSAFGGLSAAVSPDAAATIASILLDWRGRPTRSVSCGSGTAGAPLTAAAAAASDDSRDRDAAGAPAARKGPTPTDSSRSSSLSATHGGTRGGGSSAFAAFSGSAGPVDVPPASLPQQALLLPAPSLAHHQFSGALAASSLPLDWTAAGAGSLRQHQQRLQPASAVPAAAGLPGDGPAAGFAAAAAAYRSLAPHSVLLAAYSAPAPAAAAGGVAASLALPLRSPVPGAGSAGMHGGVGAAAGGSVGTAFSNPGAPGSRVGSPASSHSPSPSAAASSGLLLEAMTGGAGSSGAVGGAAAMPALPSFGYGGHLPPPHHHHAFPLPIVGGAFPLLHMRAAGPPGSLLHPHRQRHPSVHSRHEGDSDEEEAERGRPPVAAPAGVPAPRAAAGRDAAGAVSAAVSAMGVCLRGPGHDGHQHVLATSPLPPSSQALGGAGSSVEGLGPGHGERGASAGPLSAGGGFGVSLHTSPPQPHAPASASGRLSRCDGAASGGSSGSGGLPAAFGLSTSPAAPAELQSIPMAPRSAGSAASIAGPFPPSAAALHMHAMTAGRHSPHDMQLLVPSRGPGAGLEAAGAPHLLPHAHAMVRPQSALHQSQYLAHYPLGARAPASASLGSSFGAAAVKAAALPDPSPTTASAAAAVLLLKR